MSKDETTADRLYIERAKDVPIAHTISRATSARQKGDFLAYAQASLVALRRHGTFYADEGRQTPLFRWEAKWPFMAANSFTLNNTAGSVLAMFSKSMGKTFRSATFNLLTPDGVDAIGKESSSLPGVVKVFSGHEAALDYRFQLSGGDGTEVLRIVRGWGAKDPYLVRCPPFGNGRRIDWRVAATVAVVMDVTLNRSSF